MNQPIRCSDWIDTRSPSYSGAVRLKLSTVVGRQYDGERALLNTGTGAVVVIQEDAFQRLDRSIRMLPEDDAVVAELLESGFIEFPR